MKQAGAKKSFSRQSSCPVIPAVAPTELSMHPAPPHAHTPPPYSSASSVAPSPIPPHSDGTSSSVRVFIRVRPFSDAERGPNMASVNCNCQPVVRVDAADAQMITVLDPKLEFRARETYAFERCFWSVVSMANSPAANAIPASAGTPFSSQQDVYDFVGRPVLRNVLNGYNGCIFAYGQTGSGKTFTMMGTSENETPCVSTPVTAATPFPLRQTTLASKESKRASLCIEPLSTVPAGPGIIPRLATAVFESLQAVHESDKSHSFRIEVHFFEIYNEKVYDLLAVAPPAVSSMNDSLHDLRVRLDPAKGTFVEGLSSHPVRDDQDIAKLLKKGAATRHVAATRMNERSSRSHAIFVLEVTQMRLDENNESVMITSKLNLVDLAGSERTGQTGIEGMQFKEATKINLSLSTLGRVIDHLADNGHTGVAPYRESQLTWLLMDSLGGNSITTMVATISPAASNMEEILQTLRYASRAKQIVNQVVVNEDPQTRRMKSLESQVLYWKSLVEKAHSNTYTNEYVEELTTKNHEYQRIITDQKTVISTAKYDVENLQNQKKALEAQVHQLQGEAARLASSTGVATQIAKRAAVPVLNHKTTPSQRSSAGPSTASQCPATGNARGIVSNTKQLSTSRPATPREDAVRHAHPAESVVQSACPTLGRFGRDASLRNQHHGDVSLEHMSEKMRTIEDDKAKALQDKDALVIEKDNLTTLSSNQENSLSSAARKILSLQGDIDSHELHESNYCQAIERLALKVEALDIELADKSKKYQLLLETQSKAARESVTAREAKEFEIFKEDSVAWCAALKKHSAASIASFEREITTRVKSESKLAFDAVLASHDLSWEKKLAHLRKTASEQVTELQQQFEKEMDAAKLSKGTKDAYTLEVSQLKASVSHMTHQTASAVKARQTEAAEFEKAKMEFDEDRRTMQTDHEKRMLHQKRELEKTSSAKIAALETVVQGQLEASERREALRVKEALTTQQKGFDAKLARLVVEYTQKISVQADQINILQFYLEQHFIDRLEALELQEQHTRFEIASSGLNLSAVEDYFKRNIDAEENHQRERQQLDVILNAESSARLAIGDEQKCVAIELILIFLDQQNTEHEHHIREVNKLSEERICLEGQVANLKTAQRSSQAQLDTMKIHSAELVTAHADQIASHQQQQTELQAKILQMESMIQETDNKHAADRLADQRSHEMLLREVNELNIQDAQRAADRLARAEEECRCLQQLQIISQTEHNFVLNNERASFDTYKATAAAIADEALKRLAAISECDACWASLLYKHSQSISSQKIAHATRSMHEVQIAQVIASQQMLAAHRCDTAACDEAVQRAQLHLEEETSRSALSSTIGLKVELYSTVQLFTDAKAKLSNSIYAELEVSSREIRKQLTHCANAFTTASQLQEKQFSVLCNSAKEREEQTSILNDERSSTMDAYIADVAFLVQQASKESSDNIQLRLSNIASDHEKLTARLLQQQERTLVDFKRRFHSLEMISLFADEASLRRSIEEFSTRTLISLAASGIESLSLVQTLQLAHVSDATKRDLIARHAAFGEELYQDFLHDVAITARSAFDQDCARLSLRNACDALTAAATEAETGHSFEMLEKERQISTMAVDIASLQKEKTEVMMKLRLALDDNQATHLKLAEVNLSMMELELLRGGGAASARNITTSPAAHTELPSRKVLSRVPSLSGLGGIFNFLGGVSASKAQPLEMNEAGNANHHRRPGNGEKENDPLGDSSPALVSSRTVFSEGSSRGDGAIASTLNSHSAQHDTLHHPLRSSVHYRKESSVSEPLLNSLASLGDSARGIGA